MNPADGMGYLGPDLSVRGRMTGEGDVHIAGRFDGDVLLRGSVVVGEGARVAGTVAARQVAVEGRVDGPVSGEDVTIREGGRITGDVRAGRVALEDGGLLDGTVEMDVDLSGVFAEGA